MRTHWICWGGRENFSSSESVSTPSHLLTSLTMISAQGTSLALEEQARFKKQVLTGLRPGGFCSAKSAFFFFQVMSLKVTLHYSEIFFFCLPHFTGLIPHVLGFNNRVSLMEPPIHISVGAPLFIPSLKVLIR